MNALTREEIKEIDDWWYGQVAMEAEYPSHELTRRKFERALEHMENLLAHIKANPAPPATSPDAAPEVEVRIRRVCEKLSEEAALKMQPCPQYPCDCSAKSARTKP